jgi:hypothetical protein
MNDEQINQRIAEACGWTDFFVHPEFGLMGVESGTHGLRTAVPWYVCDLNAMHEAEKIMYKHYSMWNAYYYALGAGVFSLHATARKKAVAFLKALGKWEEAK